MKKISKLHGIIALLSTPPEMEILSVLSKISWKTEIELFLQSAISREN